VGRGDAAEVALLAGAHEGAELVGVHGDAMDLAERRQAASASMGSESHNTPSMSNSTACTAAGKEFIRCL
jgi:hypothetical protein